jgi:hypothetical protein
MTEPTIEEIHEKFIHDWELFMEICRKEMEMIYKLYQPRAPTFIVDWQGIEEYSGALLTLITEYSRKSFQRYAETLLAQTFPKPTMTQLPLDFEQPVEPKQGCFYIQVGK